MRRMICGLTGAAVLLAAGAAIAPGAEATSAALVNDVRSTGPRVVLLSRSYRWQWDPFRVQGDKAYAVAWITNTHRYALTLKTYCKNKDKMLRSLSGRHLIAPGQTLKWDTRSLVRKAQKDPKAVVTCRFWIDGSVDLRGRIVNQLPVRMGSDADQYSVVTFNYANFAPSQG